MRTKFQAIYYGMADAEDTAENSVTNCEPERYLRTDGARSETGAQNDNVTLRSARGPPTASS